MNVLRMHNALLLSLLIMPATMAPMIRETATTLTPEQEQLFKAIQNGDEQIVEKYIANKGDLNVVNSFGETPLYVAIHSSENKIALKLLYAGAIPSANDLYIPILTNKFANSISVIAAILDKGIDVNARVDEINLPLHVAVNAGDPRVVKLLLERGANVMAKNANGLTPIQLAHDLVSVTPTAERKELFELLKNALIERQQKHVNEQKEMLKLRGH